MKEQTLINDIATHQEIVQQIRDLQKKERDLRSEILKNLFGTDNAGTLKSQVSNLIVTGSYGFTQKLSQEEIDQAIEEGFLPESALDAIKTEYKLDKKKYDQLSDEDRDELDQYVTVKPSLPTLSVKAIKGDSDE